MTAVKPKILLVVPLQFLEGKLAEHYEVVRFWEMPATAPLPGISALVCIGQNDIAPVLERTPDMELAACFTTGYEGIDLDLCRRRGVIVTHARGATAHSVAEYALALTLASLRNIVAGSHVLLGGQWVPGKMMMGSSLQGTRVGIVGLGDIGHTFAGFAEMLGAVVSWWGPRPKPEAAWPRAAALIDLARESDVLVVCAKADAANRHLLSADILAAMPAHAILVNVARGQLVDEDALIRLLREGRIGGAALDVFETEPTPAERWRDVPNVVLTPHLGGGTRQNFRGMTEMLLDNLQRFFSGAPLATPVPGLSPTKKIPIE